MPRHYFSRSSTPLRRGITKEDCDKKHKELREKQYDLGMQLDDHTKADESYHIAASTVLSLAKRAAEIFESSEPEEKNVFLNYLLQNPTVNGKTLGYALRSPFNAILELANHPTGGRYRGEFRTFLELDWAQIKRDLDMISPYPP